MLSLEILLKLSFNDTLCFWLRHVLIFQRELGIKVQIFEKKVDSYKKMTHQLTGTVDYIKVRLFRSRAVY